MDLIGLNILENRKFPIENNENIKSLKHNVENGDIGITLSSFEDIYNMTPKGVPFPVGCVNFEDGKKRFVFSWVEDFTSLNIKDIEEYTLRIRNFPAENYPVISILLGIHNGKIDPETKENLWFFGKTDLDISLMLTRIKLVQLLNSDEILFCIFDNKSENLDSFGFSLNKSELKDMLSEVESTFSLIDNRDFKNNIKNFTLACKKVTEAFNNNGLPKSRDALNIYLKRKDLDPKPLKHNWNEFLSI